MAVLRDSCSGNLLRLFRSERELHEISYGHDPGVPPNCPSRSKSLSSLTMKSDFARSAHSRIRLSSGSSLMTLSLAVGITRFVSLANLPRESCIISPRPLELVAQHTHGFVQNGVGNVDADISGPGMTDQQCSRSAQVQALFPADRHDERPPYPLP